MHRRMISICGRNENKQDFCRWYWKRFTVILNCNNINNEKLPVSRRYVTIYRSQIAWACYQYDFYKYAYLLSQGWQDNHLDKQKDVQRIHYNWCWYVKGNATPWIHRFIICLNAVLQFICIVNNCCKRIRLKLLCTSNICHLHGITHVIKTFH